MSITFNKGWNLIGIGNLGGADAVLKDPNNIIDSDIYYYDNINKKYVSTSSESLAQTNNLNSEVKSFVLKKTNGYWAKVKDDTDNTQLQLEYYYSVRSNIKTNSTNGDKPFVVLNLSNTNPYSKTRLEAFISDIKSSVDILDTLFQTPQTDDLITIQTIDISLQTNDVLDGSLGQAGEGVIQINDQNSGTNGLGKKTGTGETLETLSQNIPVIIHEIMHVLGFGLRTKWSGLVQDVNPDNKNYFYYGKNARDAYNELVNNGVTYSKIPIEDDGGAGTEYAHWEEDEIRTDSSEISYPYFKEEIMSGYLNGNNYISKLTLGAFMDMDYLVNYDSVYVTTPPVTTS